MSATITFPSSARTARLSSARPGSARPGSARSASARPASGQAIYFTPDASLAADGLESGAAASHFSLAASGSASAGRATASSSTAPRRRLHITSRGRTVLAIVIIVPLLAILAGFVLNGGGAAATATSGNVHFEHVTVSSGETLWQVAEQVAPQSDPRDVIADIVSLNNLPSAEVMAGQSLAIPTKYDR